MATFQKRGKTWQYTISHYEDGVYDPIRKGGFKTKAEAKVVANEVENKLNKGILPNLKPIVFSDYFDEWVKLYKKDVARSTLDSYENTLNTIENYFGNSTIQRITKREYQAFLNEYGKSKARETVKKLNSQIRACVTEAIEEDIIFKDFTRKVTITGRIPENKEGKYLDYEEMKKLEEYLKTKMEQLLNDAELLNRHLDMRYFLIQLGLVSGARFAELLGLTFNDFDFDNNLITINKTWGYLERMPTGFGNTKTYESRRVKVGSFTMSMFKRAMKSIPQNKYNLFFFRNDSRYKIIDHSSTNNLLKELTSNLGTKEITLHGLRHTHASILLYNKISILYVSERLGHANIQTTYNYYSHIIKELRQEDDEKTIKIFV